MASRSEKELTNYAKLCKAVNVVGTEILRDILNRQITPNKIRAKLRQYSKKIKFSPDQWECITHAPKYGYSHFDFSLLYTILSQIPSLNVEYPTNGWGRDALPGRSDKTLGDNIERLRMTRSIALGHINDKSVSYTLFEEYSNLLKNVAQDMESRYGGTYNKNVCEILDRDMTEEDIKKQLTEMEKMTEYLDLEDKYPSVKVKRNPGDVLTPKLSDERKNFLRMSMLCFKFGTKAVRTVFDTYIPPSQLHREIQKNKQTILGLKRSGKITQSHMDILFPRPPPVPAGMVSCSTSAPAVPRTTSSKFDVSLMLCLLRSLSTIPGPVKGWFAPPDNTDVSEAADLCRIRNCRNFIAHNTEGKVNTVDFRNNWKILEEALNRISANSYKQDMESLKVISLDGTDRDEEIEDCKRDIEACKKEIENLKYVIPESVRDRHHRIVSGWKDEDIVFYETRASRAVYFSVKSTDIFRNNNVTTIIGNSGTGKSAIAHHNAIQLEKQGFVIHPVITPADILELHNPNQKQVFVIDDPVGVYSLDQEMLAAWKRQDLHLKACLETKSTKVLLTVGRMIANEYSRQNTRSILSANVIDLNDNKYMLCEEEKYNILRKHLKNKHVFIDENKMRIFAGMESNLEFPLLCRLFASNTFFQSKRRSFFLHPIKNLQEEIKQFKAEDRYKYCALVLCAIFTNEIDPTFFDVFKISEPRRELVKTFMEACGLESSTPFIKLKMACDALLGVYLKLEDDCYVFVHQIINDAVLHLFGLDYPEIVLRYSTSSFVREHIRIVSLDIACNLENDNNFILIDKEKYKDRLLSDLRNGNSYDVVCNPYMSDETFLKFFCDILRGNGIEFTIDLIMHTPEWNQLQSPLHWIVITGNTILFKFLYTFLGRETFTFYVMKITNMLQLSCISGSFQIFKIITRMVGLNANIDTLLHAVIGNNVEIVKYLIDSGASVEKCEEKGIQLLHIAIRNENLQLLTMLLEHHADVNICDDNGESPVFIAATIENTGVLEVLIRHNADVHICNNKGFSPTHAAVVNGHGRVLELLIKQQADVNNPAPIGVTPLCLAVLYGHVDIVELLIKHRADVNKCSFYGLGASPAFAAAQIGHTEALECLIKHNADVNKCANDGTSPVNITARNGHIETLELLIRYHADVNKCDQDYITPVYAVAQNGHTEVLELLIKHHADVNKCSKDGSTPLHVAALNGHTEVFELLIKHNANVNKSNENGTTPLYIAAQTGHIEVLGLLLKHHAKVNKCGKDGTPPIFIAAQNGHTEILELLIKHLADVNKCSKGGTTPLCIAAQIGHTEVVKLLIKHNADVNKCSDDHTNPVYIAAQNGHTEVLELLIKHNADVNNRANCGMCPAYIAAHNGNMEILD